MESIPTQVTVSSRLPVTPGTLWGAVVSTEGINHEMGPWLKFTPPGEIDLLSTAAGGEVLPLKIRGPFGLPLGRYPLKLERFEEGRGFLEQTWMLPFLLWQHERKIEADGDGVKVTDALGWRWKLALLDPLVRAGVGAFFRHRHRRLRHRFEP